MEEPGREEFIPSANMEITRDQTIKLCIHNVLTNEHIILTSNDDHILMVFSIIVYGTSLQDGVSSQSNVRPVHAESNISCQMLE